MNNREIKFRAWDKYLGKFIDPMLIGKLDFLDQTYVFCQFTGLKDIDGKEIYEGDIIQNEFGSKMIVEYKEIQESDDMTAPGIGFQFMYYPNKMEIIGNIFENPDLLKQ